MALVKAARFVLTDESLDRHSEVVKVSGVKLTNFRKNPIALFNHIRSGGSFWGPKPTKDAILPVGIWKNITKEGGQNPRIEADFYYDDEDEFANMIGQKVANGILKAVSIGFRRLAYSDDPGDKVQGQKGLTITKSELMEASIVDIPANPNAVIMKAVRVEDDLKTKKDQQLPEDIFIKNYFVTNNDSEMSKNKSFIELCKEKFNKVFDTEDQAKGFVEAKIEGLQEKVDAATTEDNSGSASTEAEDQPTGKTTEVNPLAEKLTAAENKINSLQESMEELTKSVTTLAKTLNENKEEERKDDLQKSLQELVSEVNALKGVSSDDATGDQGNNVKEIKEDSFEEIVKSKDSEKFVNGMLDGTITSGSY